MQAQSKDDKHLGYPTQKPRALLDGDIEDVKTRFMLRKAVMELHLGFSTGGEEQI